MTMRNTRVTMMSCAASAMLLIGYVRAQAPSAEGAAGAESAQAHVSDRPSTTLFKGQPGVLRADISFDPSTHGVTARLLVQDSRGNFIPNIRRDDFIVYEDGVRQKEASVDIEHLPVSVGMLAEYGGRYQSLNEALAGTVNSVAGQFLDEVGEHDAVALWRYGDTVEEMARFTEDRETLQKAVTSLPRPSFSELNFYDALIAALKRMPGGGERQALIVISSGVDTFSKSRFNDVLAAIRASAIPVYVIDIGKAVRQRRAAGTAAGSYPESRLQRAQRELARIARASGGRLYIPESAYDTAPIFDDILEHLRVRYVIRYTSSGVLDAARPRTVRIELVKPGTGRPLEILDEDGRRVPWKMTVEGSYVPTAVPMAGAGGEPPAGTAACLSVNACSVRALQSRGERG